MIMGAVCERRMWAVTWSAAIAVVLALVLAVGLGARGSGQEAATDGSRLVSVGIGFQGQLVMGASSPGTRLDFEGTALVCPVVVSTEGTGRGGEFTVICSAADGSVLKLAPPIMVSVAKEDAGTNGAALIWIGDAAQVFRGKFQLTAGLSGSIKLLSIVELEDYVAGVVPYEIGASSPFEALCAQAIVARTQVLTSSRRHLDDGFDVCNSTHCQVYQGASREIAYPAVRRAVEATAGEILSFNGAPATGSNYHACCGGLTESASALWKLDVPYMHTTACRPGTDGAEAKQDSSSDDEFCDEKALVARIENPDPADYCYGANGYRWSYTITQSQLAMNLAPILAARPTVVELRVLERTPRGSATKLAVITPSAQYEIKGEYAIRLALGGLVLIKSGVFVVRAVTEADAEIPSAFEFRGAGYGHGVGMCQYGARKMAALGHGHYEILQHYYPGVHIEPIGDQASQ